MTSIFRDAATRAAIDRHKAGCNRKLMSIRVVEIPSRFAYRIYLEHAGNEHCVVEVEGDELKSQGAA